MAKHDSKFREKTIHDGISPIKAPKENDEDKAFQILWDYLVPPYGQAPTAQGEIIRIAGRVRHEFLDNGCINWDEDSQEMLNAFLAYLQLGHSFDEEDVEIAQLLVQLLNENGAKGFVDDRLTATLCSCAMTWVKQNPDVLAPLPAKYSR